ncbi:hypothetical protein [Duganella fentianensis]|uniref:hypothetical protein n=1 Tax=Duganella fentianensis TaxID=2692177 RepID=UPI0032B2AD07
MTVISQLSRTLLALALSVPALAMAGDVIVISHGSLNMPAGDVRDAYIGEKQIEGGTKLVIFDNAAVQKDFLDKVVQVDAAKYSSIWTKKGFREGLNPPAVKATDAEVIAAVKSTPGAVGYVSKAPADVKVVKKF